MAETTTDVLAEWATPSVISRADFRAALRTFQPMLHRVSGQAARLQALACVAEFDEEREGVCQKFTGLADALRAVQMKHDRALELLYELARAYDRVEREMAELEREHLSPRAGV